MLYGWDASDFDHNRGMRAQHVKNAKAEGIRFFTHKITEGTRYVHRQAGAKVKAAVDASIPFIGFYVVTRTPGAGDGSISAQCDYAIAEATKQYPGWKNHKGFFWQVDLEHWSYDKVAPKHGNEMCKLLESKTGKKAVLYAPKWAYGDSISGSYPLWASNYNGSGAPANFKTQWSRTGQMNHAGWQPYSGRKPRILQYSSDATIGGQRTCDANVFDGSESDFAKMIGGSVSSPAPQPKPGTPVSKPKPLPTFSGVTFGPIGAKIAELLSYAPHADKLIITSALRSTNDHHGGLSYGGSDTAAVDANSNRGNITWSSDEGRRIMRDTAKWLEDVAPGYRNIVELIHTTPFSTDDGFYVKNGVKIASYGAATDAAHNNHIHLAMSAAQVDAALKKLRGTSTPAPQPKESSAVWDTIIQKINKDSGTKPQMKAASFLAYCHEYALEALRRLSAVLKGQKAADAKLDAILAKLKDCDHGGTE